MAMGSCAEDKWPGGVTGADAEVGALVWVRRRNGSWWPGRILGMDELPENTFIPPRSASTPIKLLGRPDGSIDWYNLEKSKRVKSFRCGEYNECIQKVKALAREQKRTQTEGRYVHREDAIIHALEIERSCVLPEGHLHTYRSCAFLTDKVPKHINQTVECSKEGRSSIQDHRRSKMKIVSFVTPRSKGNQKSNENLLPLVYEGIMKCYAADSDAVELDGTVEDSACELTGLENNIQVYNVELTTRGNYMGFGLPLAVLASKSTGKPIKGYPITVEVFKDYSALNIDDHLPAIGSVECLLKSRVSLACKKRSS